ncbi:CHAD domain-containing protein [Candidatus Omnitrophota bacterium]
MFHTKMSGYYTLKLESIRHNFKLAQEHNDPDGIHDLRVDLKRMKAFFALVESINHGFKAKKEFRNFKKIARNTGRLRDVQVQTELIENINESLDLDCEDYRAYLMKKESDYSAAFQKYALKNPLQNLIKSEKIIKKALKEISPVRADARVQGRFYNLRNNLVFLHSENELKDDILHEVRKLSKETHYVLEIIQSCFRIFRDSKGFLKKLIKVHKLLGAWHDYDVSLRYLNNFQKDCKVDVTQAPYSVLVKHIHDQKTLYRKNILSAFEDFSETAAVYEHQK